MPFTSFISKRYLQSRKKNRFLSFALFLSFFGVVVSVFAFLVIYGVGAGFSTYLKKVTLGFDAPLRVSPQNETESQEVTAWLLHKNEVVFVIPFLEFDAILKTPKDESTGVRVRAFREEDLKKLSTIKFYSFDETNTKFHLYMGEELFTSLEFIPDGNTDLTLINPFADVGPTGEWEPVYKDFNPTGVMSTGFYDFDSHYVFVSFDEGLALSGLISKTGTLLVFLKDENTARELKNELKTNFADLSVLTWDEANATLFSVFKTEKVGFTLLLLLIIFIASVNMVSFLVLLVLSKKKDVGILAALGVSPSKMRRIFIVLGGKIALYGSLVGMLLAFIVLVVIKIFPISLDEAYYFDTVPVVINPFSFIAVFCMAPLLGMVASLAPAFLFSKVKPVPILKEAS